MKTNKLKSKVLIFLIVVSHTFMVLGFGGYKYSSDYRSSAGDFNNPETIVISAASGGWTKTELIFNESTGQSLIPRIIADKAGNVHFVWYSDANYSGAGTDEDIFYLLWNGSTNSWGSVEVVSLEHPSDSYLPVIAVDLEGNVHLAWQDKSDYNGAGADRDIFYKRRNATTGTWTPTVVVSNVSSAVSFNPEIAVDLHGNAHIVWDDQEDYNGSGTDTDIFYRCWNATTDNWTITQVLSTSTSYTPSIAVDSNDTVHVVWHSWLGPSVRYRFWNATSQIWSGTELIATESSTTTFGPVIDVDGAGHVHVAWREVNGTDDRGFEQEDIFYKRRSAATGNWTPIEWVSSESTRSSIQPSLTTDGAGNVHVAWTDSTPLDGSGTDGDIFYKNWNATTREWTSTEVISTESTGAVSSKPTIAVDTMGCVHIAWEDLTDYMGAGLDYNIFYKKSIDIDILNTPVLEPIFPNPGQDGIVELNWSAIVGATTYYLYRELTPIISIDGMPPIATVISTNYTDTIQLNGLYYYAVVAGNGTINSSISNCENVTVAISTLDPVVLDPISPIVDTDGIVELDWDEVENATTYYIYRNTSNITSIANLTPIASVTTSHYIDNITVTGIYYYVVIAGAGWDNSTLSNCENVIVVLDDDPEILRDPAFLIIIFVILGLVTAGVPISFLILLSRKRGW